MVYSLNSTPKKRRNRIDKNWKTNNDKLKSKHHDITDVTYVRVDMKNLRSSEGSNERSWFQESLLQQQCEAEEDRIQRTNKKESENQRSFYE